MDEFRASRIIDAILSGEPLSRALVEASPQPAFHNAYEWHDSHTKHYKRLNEEDEVHATNAQAAAGRISTYQQFARDYGRIDPGTRTNLKIYKYGPEHSRAIDALIQRHGYQVYYAGGKYGKPDLANRNYDTGHLMVYDPSEGSGGDFGEQAYTEHWRKTHELAHALTHQTLNAKYGEARRMGKMGHHRTPHEALRAVEWEHMAANKQRELSAAIGVHLSDSDFGREYNTVLHDAVHRAVTGLFSNPAQEGFHPHDQPLPLEHSLGLVRAHAARLGLGLHDTFKKRSPQ